MATTIFVAPYVRGPALSSETNQPARCNILRRWVRQLCAFIRPASSSQDRPLPAASDNVRGPWAYRVVQHRQRTDVGAVGPRPAPFAVEICDLELAAIEPASLRTGDFIVVEAGQTVFADGTVLAGIAVIDESAVSGQSEPIICSAESRASVMRESRVVSGQILIEIAPRRGHPLDWIETPTKASMLTQPNLRRAPVRP